MPTVACTSYYSATKLLTEQIHEQNILTSVELNTFNITQPHFFLKCYENPTKTLRNPKERQTKIETEI